MVCNERAPALENSNRMRDVRRHDGDEARPSYLSLTPDRDLELTFDDDPNLLVGVMVLVDGAAGGDVIV